MDSLNSGVAVVALVVSILAYFASQRATQISERSARLTRLQSLKEIHRRVGKGREAMHSIMQQWSEKNPDRDAYRGEGQSEFIDYYNTHYHNASPEREERTLSTQIRDYIAELDDISESVDRCIFSYAEVFGVLGDTLRIDFRLIGLYCKAHRKEHPKACIWKHVDSLLEEVARRSKKT